VVKSLLDRVRNESEVHSGHVSREWSGKFLTAGGQKNAEDDTSDSHTIRRILHFGKETANSSRIVKKPKYLHRNIILSGDTRESLPNRDLLSVKRIVKRAFLTDLDSPYYLDDEELHPTKAFSLAISRAKAMMIPDAKGLKEYLGSRRQQLAVDYRSRTELGLLPIR